MNDNVLFLMCYIPTPLILLVAGLVIWRFPAPYGSAVGYKTKRSYASAEAWDFAQVYWGRLMTIISVPTLALSVGAGVVQIIKNVDENAGLAICMGVVTLQIVPIFVSIAITENALKKNF